MGVGGKGGKDFPSNYRNVAVTACYEWKGVGVTFGTWVAVEEGST